MLLSLFRVSGHSMEPTFKPGQTLFVSSIPYLFSRPKIGDVIVVKDPRDKRLLLKRITKIVSRHSGERSDSRIHSTGSGRVRFWSSPVAAGSRQRRGQNDKEYFVAGDNPEESTDSRMFGVIKRDEIVGKVLQSFLTQQL